MVLSVGCSNPKYPPLHLMAASFASPPFPSPVVQYPVSTTEYLDVFPPSF